MKASRAFSFLVLAICFLQANNADAQTKWKEEVPLAPDELGHPRTEIRNLCGIGVVLITSAAGSFEVSEVLPDSGAAIAGILPKDVILQIDDTKTQGMNLPQVVGVIRGDPDTKVTITILRGVKSPRKVVVTRKPINPALLK